MTIWLLSLAFFLAILIVVTMLLQGAVLALGYRERRESRRRNHAGTDRL